MGVLEYTIRVEFVPWEPIADYENRNAAFDALQTEIAPVLATLEKDPRGPVGGTFYLLTPAACETIAALADDLTKRQRGRLSIVRVVERVAGSEADAAEWFALTPRTDFETEGRDDGIVRVNADRIKGRDAVRETNSAVYLTQAARDALANEKLGQFETFWVADTGKYAAPQWYQLVPTSFVGRGVDHPWFDPATRGRVKTDWYKDPQPTEDPWRRGVNAFELRQLRADLPGASAPIKRLLQSMQAASVASENERGQTFTGPLRLLRRFLPTTADVAFAWLGKPHTASQDASVGAATCVSRRAHDFLVARRLATAADFTPLIVLDDAPAGAAVFDGDVRPPPIYPPEVAAKMRAVEARLRAKFEAKPKPEAPVKPVPLKPLLTKLKRVLRSRGAEVAKGASADPFASADEAAGLPLPARWAEVLKAVDGLELPECAIFDGEAALLAASCAELPGYHRSSVESIRLGWPDMPAGYLAVASSDFGDKLFLDTAHATPEGDCPVVWVDHETSEIVRTWASVTLFLKEALESPPSA